ncbi:CAP domain-containing protein [Dactylosporangium sp. AC04546]|uniref:CAP domain-containing protein n=1 Tax=Dactylosporangium sp. AC04546 TaxID=2862460 RepID=UPI001EDF1832|nr:CAP domain-containing protein [Dactylosporangium sp. AC04546]WVK85233.1 CAP domain-containing protein [Dactylosporangium sp. AC04546]
MVPRLVDRLGPVGIAAAVTAVLILSGLGFLIVPALTDAGPASGHNAAPAPSLPAESSVAPPPSSAAPSSAAPTSAAPTLVSANFNNSYEDRVVQLVNNERRKEKCEPVRMDAKLRTAARAHSADMATGDFTGTKGSDGSEPADRAQRAGFSGFEQELVAKGGDAGDVVKRWLRDDGDRDVLVDCDITSIGVGAAMRGRTAYWTVDTGRA